MVAKKIPESGTRGRESLCALNDGINRAHRQFKKADVLTLPTPTALSPAIPPSAMQSISRDASLALTGASQNIYADVFCPAA